ncbi:hypothetical protein HRbin14_02292 [bacterium HR14]|nr:hypothetical protein HRbin14_02292 [bacterium HR14]
MAALLRGHRKNNRFGAFEGAVVYRHLAQLLLELIVARQKLQQLLEWTHAPNLLHLHEHIFEVKGRLAQFFLHALGFLFLHGLLHALNQRQHITHAEDAAGDAVGVERLEGVSALADANKAHGLAHHGFERERRAATRIAVHLGENDPCQLQSFVERLRHIDRLLPRGGVHDQQNLVGLEGVAHLLQFLHQGFVDLQASCGVQNQHIVAVGAGIGVGGARDAHRVARPSLFGRVDIDAYLLAQHLQLLDGGRALEVARCHHRFAPLRARPARQLRAGGGLTRPLQATEHEHGGRRRRPANRLRLAPQKRNQLVAHDAHHMLVGRQALQHLVADRLLTHPRNKLLHHPKINIRLQQRQADFAKHLVYGLLV